ncbi:cysteine desulfurase [endosymbiont of Sipalinus gigas]|uniref:aminotransferase class V-fold PLP-dependent enzyme n=1 Tax=endosymbiont of Sipalinus gigas TaxID=1972134 RepID=UPI000DC71A7E|nr:aminotransferase class V-fold PLP-dependent enzyme [endosymbiont of Sipalinus gigas]BBA85234.1 cysteine desulfurase [endosymbiont of Sipalinus gigas]
MFNIKKIRYQFPIFKIFDDEKIIYLDNASTTHKPKCVIKEMNDFYLKEYSSIKKGIYDYSINNTERIENIRKNISYFINSKNYREIIFTKGTTESINLIVNTLGRKILSNNNNILISISEHHSNIVPWINLSKEIKYEIRFIELLNDGNLNLDKMLSLVDKYTKIISITQLSNVLGIENNIKNIIKILRSLNNDLFIIVDGTQYITHNKVNVQDLDCDFYMFSGHKIYGPTGIGILYVKEKIISNLPIWQSGGSIIKNININNNKIDYIDYPWRFEPGSINAASIIGLNSAINFIENINFINIIKWEKLLINYLINLLKENFKDIEIYGENKNKISIISFNIKKINNFDIGTVLNKNKIYIRTGNQCAIPLMNFYNIDGLCRVSISIYNNFNDINTFIDKLIYTVYILKKI